MRLGTSIIANMFNVKRYVPLNCQADSRNIRELLRLLLSDVPQYLRSPHFSAKLLYRIKGTLFVAQSFIVLHACFSWFPGFTEQCGESSHPCSSVFLCTQRASHSVIRNTSPLLSLCWLPSEQHHLPRRFGPHFAIRTKVEDRIWDTVAFRSFPSIRRPSRRRRFGKHPGVSDQSISAKAQPWPRVDTRAHWSLCPNSVAFIERPVPDRHRGEGTAERLQVNTTTVVAFVGCQCLEGTRDGCDCLLRRTSEA
jgi:hypothetical protein